ncbi:hypothetical protein CVT24_008944 [Panaeolus cyanescens]|uniref:F-box domain-containing protein n=1 Tax=Panaeolus cyanescens TaxID=181874 RepID=A0A409YAW4_9AGAR|nr:hypothetical protein CVT24_008944 [Panaeolus cyanescens]
MHYDYLDMPGGTHESIVRSKSIHDLPVEIFPTILRFLQGDYQSIIALTTTSKTIASEANKLLYRDITRWPANRERHTKFLTTIIASPELGLAVHSYSIVVASTDLDPFFELLHSGLKVMNKLQHLTIEDLVVSHYMPNTHLTRVLTGGSFSLKSFHWLCRSDENPIAEFLATQHDLEELTISWHSVWRKRILPDMCADVDASTCPRLRRVCGEIGTLKMFLPGRNVQDVSCPPPSGTPIGEIEETLPLISRELGRVKSLCCSIYYAGGFLYSYLENLEVLHLVGFLVDAVRV